MSENTKIAWTGTRLPDGTLEPGFTFNPWWGCTKVSTGCLKCYAETWDTRWGGDHWGANKPRKEFGDKHWNEPLKWNAKCVKDGIRRKVFCASMGDVFDMEAPEGARDRLWLLIQATPMLDWLVLTKRPERILENLPSDWGEGYQNVWLGTSVENQTVYHPRMSALLQVPARVRFLSCEPLLGFLDLCLDAKFKPDGGVSTASDKYVHELIHWVICGGESGHGARKMELEWARSLQFQCACEQIPFFMKQFGNVLAKKLGLKHPKGEDPHEWDTLLQVQEFPQ